MNEINCCFGFSKWKNALTKCSVWQYVTPSSCSLFKAVCSWRERAGRRNVRIVDDRLCEKVFPSLTKNYSQHAQRYRKRSRTKSQNAIRIPLNIHFNATTADTSTSGRELSYLKFYFLKKKRTKEEEKHSNENDIYVIII